MTCVGRVGQAQAGAGCDPVVGVDAHDPGDTTPITMGRYQLRGTPSLVVVDRAGRIRVNALGRADDIVVGATLARLIDEPRP